jgi:phage anti-repressor protein
MKSIKEALPVTYQVIGGKLVPAVSARDLYIYLEVEKETGQTFEDWFARATQQCEFMEGVDYAAQ